MPRHPTPPPLLPPWGEPAPILVDKARLALEFEVSPPAVSGWVKKGLPVRPDGLVNVAEAAAWILETFDPLNGYATRVQAHDVQRYLYNLRSERGAAQRAVEHAGASTYAAAARAGLAEHAEALADAVAADMVLRMNEELVNEANVPLPPPPAGVWRERVEEPESAA